MINVDYGIGSSFVINDHIYRGSLYGSGQIGHTIVNPDGNACDCGRYGCLETVASLSALKKQARMWLKTQPEATLAPEQLTTASLIEARKEGDVQIRAWVDNAANAIGLSLYNFLNILNINQIWLYGAAAPSVSSGWKVSSNKRVSTPLTTGIRRERTPPKLALAS